MSILVRDWFKCQYCWNNVDGWAVLQVDHIIPVSKWWTNDDYNLVTSCRDCNMWKFDLPYDFNWQMYSLWKIFDNKFLHLFLLIIKC